MNMLADRRPSRDQVRVAIGACGVGGTDLRAVDGELAHSQFPIVPGHDIVGRIDAVAAGLTGHEVGQRVGVSWHGRPCGACSHGLHQRENPCDRPLFAGDPHDGGFATTTVGDPRFALLPGTRHGDACASIASVDGSLIPSMLGEHDDVQP